MWWEVGCRGEHGGEMGVVARWWVTTNMSVLLDNNKNKLRCKQVQGLKKEEMEGHS
jgi:hypothetical protein